MKFIYKNKTHEQNINEFLADFLEENVLNLKNNEQEDFIKLCHDKNFPNTYFTGALLDFDKIVDDKDNLKNIIREFKVYEWDYQ